MSTAREPTPTVGTDHALDGASFSAVSNGLREWLVGRGSTPPWHPPVDICLRVLGAVCVLADRPLGPRGWGPAVGITDATADVAFALLLGLCRADLCDGARAPQQDMGMPRSAAERAALADILPHLAEAWSSGRRALTAYDDEWNRNSQERAELSAAVARRLQQAPPPAPSTTGPAGITGTERPPR